MCKLRKLQLPQKYQIHFLCILWIRNLLPTYVRTSQHGLFIPTKLLESIINIGNIVTKKRTFLYNLRFHIKCTYLG